MVSLAEPGEAGARGRWGGGPGCGIWGCLFCNSTSGRRLFAKRPCFDALASASSWAFAVGAVLVELLAWPRRSLIGPLKKSIVAWTLQRAEVLRMLLQILLI